MRDSLAPISRKATYYTELVYVSWGGVDISLWNGINDVKGYHVLLNNELVYSKWGLPRG